MRMNEVNDAELEARRFLRACEALQARFNADPEATPGAWLIGSPETAAVRRASMDLTRALARMRRP